MVCVSMAVNSVPQYSRVLPLSRCIAGVDLSLTGSLRRALETRSYTTALKTSCILTLPNTKFGATSIHCAKIVDLITRTLVDVLCHY
jgi:hypothetical protein